VMWVICKKTSIRTKTCCLLCRMSLCNIFYATKAALTLLFLWRPLIFSQAHFNCTSKYFILNIFHCVEIHVNP
jgi:hypothetical protein